MYMVQHCVVGEQSILYTITRYSVAIAEALNNAFHNDHFLIGRP